MPRYTPALALSALALAACTSTPVMPVLTEAATQYAVSDANFATTEARFRAAVNAPGGPEILSVIDHGANAAGAGLDLPPTKLFLIGNPKAGTPLMQAAPLIGMELPVHILIYESEGEVRVGYPLMPVVGRDYSLVGEDARLMAMDEAITGVVNKATRAGR